MYVNLQSMQAQTCGDITISQLNTRSAEADSLMFYSLKHESIYYVTPVIGSLLAVAPNTSAKAFFYCSGIFAC